MRHLIGEAVAVSAFAIPGALCVFLIVRDWWYDRDARRRIALLLERERRLRT